MSSRLLAVTFGRHHRRTRPWVRSSSGQNISPASSEHKVLCDGQTLYIGQDLAEALGWQPEQGVSGLKLSLHGWAPHYFTITPQGTDNGQIFVHATNIDITDFQTQNVLPVEPSRVAAITTYIPYSTT